MEIQIIFYTFVVSTFSNSFRPHPAYQATQSALKIIFDHASRDLHLATLFLAWLAVSTTHVFIIKTINIKQLI